MEKSLKIKKILLITLIIIGIIIVGIKLFSPNHVAEVSIDIDEQLSLGDKYLLELDYENAIIAFNKVIEVDPMNERAYLGLSDAYIGKGDIASAIKALENGIENIQDVSSEFINKLKLLKLNSISAMDYITMDSIYHNKCEEIIELFRSEKFDEIPKYMRNEVALPIRDSILDDSEEKIIYYGDIEDGQPQGLGICVYSKGRKNATEAYVGQFDDGLRSGKGIAIFTDRYSQGYYLGEWDNDVVNGSGKMYKDNSYSGTEDTGFDGVYDSFTIGVTKNGKAEGYWLEGWYENGKIRTEDGDDTNGTTLAGYQFYYVDGQMVPMGKVSSEAWWVDPNYDEKNIIGSELMTKAYIVYNDGTEEFKEAPHEHAGKVRCKTCREFHENYVDGSGQVNSFHPWKEDIQPENTISWDGFYID